MVFDNVLDNTEAEARTAGRTGAGFVGPVEPLKQTGNIVRQNADAGVGDGNGNRFRRLRRAQGDAAAARGVGNRIVKQVDQHLGHFVAVGMDNQRCVNGIHQADIGFLGLRRQPGRDFDD